MIAIKLSIAKVESRVKEKSLVHDVFSLQELPKKKVLTGLNLRLILAVPN